MVQPPLLQVFSTCENLPGGDSPISANALCRPDAKHWINTMQDEMQSIKDNQTWVLTDYLVAKPFIRKGCSRLRMTLTTGSNLYKCRLVAKGYSQSPVFDIDKA